VGHHVENPVALEDASAGAHGDVVSVFDGKEGVNFKMHVHHQQVPHFSEAEIVDALNSFA